MCIPFGWIQPVKFQRFDFILAKLNSVQTYLATHVTLYLPHACMSFFGSVFLWRARSGACKKFSLDEICVEANIIRWQCAIPCFISALKNSYSHNKSINLHDVDNQVHFVIVKQPQKSMWQMRVGKKSSCIVGHTLWFEAIFCEINWEGKRQKMRKRILAAMSLNKA